MKTIIKFVYGDCLDITESEESFMLNRAIEIATKVHSGQLGKSGSHIFCIAPRHA